MTIMTYMLIFLFLSIRSICFENTSPPTITVCINKEDSYPLFSDGSRFLTTDHVNKLFICPPESKIN